MQGRTVILVSHHVQLCASGASYIIALDNGRVLFDGSKEGFYSSGIMRTSVHCMESSGEINDKEGKVTSKEGEETVLAEELDPPSETSSTVAPSNPASIKANKKPARKLMEEEKREVGHVARDIWETYIRACGNVWYWSLLISFLVMVSASPVLENGWLRYNIPIAFDNVYLANWSVRYWSDATLQKNLAFYVPLYAAITGIKYPWVDEYDSPAFYISVYAALTGLGLVIATVRWFIQYNGSIRASRVLHEQLLESVLFADIRFHDTVSRGRSLNRFAKDVEGWLNFKSILTSIIYFSFLVIDSSVSRSFGRSIGFGLSTITVMITISYLGGLPSIFTTFVLCIVYWNGKD